MSKASGKEKDAEIEWLFGYDTWDRAAAEASGYDDDNILQKVKKSTLKVVRGEAAYERDSVTFDKIEFSWPLLACLQKIALKRGGHLSLIDFGGALGTSYFQNKSFLSQLQSVKWFVVEQEHFVACGKDNFENSELKFAYRIDDVLQTQAVDCLLLSGVLQVLPDPYVWMKKIVALGLDHIIIDRTAFIDGKMTLAVEKVPGHIYNASYAHWFFNEEQFRSNVEPHYEIAADFDSYADGKIMSSRGQLLYWKGFYLKKRNSECKR